MEKPSSPAMTDPLSVVVLFGRRRGRVEDVTIERLKPAAVRLQDLPEVIIEEILSHLDDGCQGRLVHILYRPTKIGKQLLANARRREPRTSLYYIRLNTGTDIVSGSFPVRVLDQMLGVDCLRVKTLALKGRDLVPPYWIPRTIESEARRLGAKISRRKCTFPALHFVDLDRRGAVEHDLLLYLADLAPNLETLLVDLSMVFGKKLGSRPYVNVQNLQITYNMGDLDPTAEFLDLCPKTARLCLSPGYKARLQLYNNMISSDYGQLLPSMSQLPLKELEWWLDVSVFARCIAEGGYRLKRKASRGKRCERPGCRVCVVEDKRESCCYRVCVVDVKRERRRFPILRRVWLACYSWKSLTYRISTPRRGEWPSLGMTPRMSACCDACPLLDSFHIGRHPAFPLHPTGQQAYFNSYVHATGEGELLHALLLIDGEWLEATDYRGEVVPLHVIDRMRAAEGLTNEAWGGPERRRGMVVGDGSWEILTEWYANGARAHPATSTPETDEFRESCCVQ